METEVERQIEVILQKAEQGITAGSVNEDNRREIEVKRLLEELNSEEKKDKVGGY